MRSLPKYICRHPDGLLIRVQRGRVLYQAFIPLGRATPPRSTDQFQTAIARALQLRDRFLALAPPRRTHSNTGHLGISETTQWSNERPYPRITVGCMRSGKWKQRAFGFGRARTRDKALAAAKQWRSETLLTTDH